MLRAIYNLEEETLWPLSQFISSHNPYEDAMFRMFDYITVKVVIKSSDKQISCFFILNSEVIFISPIAPTGVSEKQLLRGYPWENHAKGATVHITELAQTFHIGITWWSIGKYGISFVQASFFSFFQGGYPWTAKSTLKYVQIL